MFRFTRQRNPEEGEVSVLYRYEQICSYMEYILTKAQAILVDNEVIFENFSDKSLSEKLKDSMIRTHMIDDVDKHFLSMVNEESIIHLYMSDVRVEILYGHDKCTLKYFEEDEDTDWLDE